MADPDDGDVSLTVGGHTVSGWTDVRITRGCETCPNAFEIGMTDLYPGQASAVVVSPGDACVISIGADVALTGYVDSVEPSYDADVHEIRITGRGKCQDLVDTSAEVAGGQFVNMNLLQIAQQLAAPLGIEVDNQAVAPVVPQFNVLETETRYEVIERACRWAGLLCYETRDGRLVLSALGAETHASGPSEGVNVLKARGRFNMAERFSDYHVYLMALDVLSDLGEGGNLIGAVKDPNVTRFRPKAFVAGGQRLGTGLRPTARELGSGAARGPRVPGRGHGRQLARQRRDAVDAEHPDPDRHCPV